MPVRYRAANPALADHCTADTLANREALADLARTLAYDAAALLGDVVHLADTARTRTYDAATLLGDVVHLAHAVWAATYNATLALGYDTALAVRLPDNTAVPATRITNLDATIEGLTDALADNTADLASLATNRTTALDRTTGYFTNSAWLATNHTATLDRAAGYFTDPASLAPNNTTTCTIRRPDSANTLALGNNTAPDLAMGQHHAAIGLAGIQ